MLSITVYDNGSSPGRQITVPDDKTITVGRTADCDIVISAADVSRRHCLITWNGQTGCFIVTDMSSNGTYDSSGRRLPGEQACQVSNNTRLRIGNTGAGISLHYVTSSEQRGTRAGSGTGTGSGTGAAGSDINQGVLNLAKKHFGQVHPFQPAGGGPGMKWYKFLIYAGLFLAAIANLVLGVLHFVGSDEIRELRDLYYTVIGRGGASIRAFEIMAGIIALLICAAFIVTWFLMAGFKKSAPKALMISFSASMAVNLLMRLIITLQFRSMMDKVLEYDVFGFVNTRTYSYYGLAPVIAGLIIGVILAAVFVTSNMLYFDKRRDMFVN